jgi:hypothetical protein
MSNTEDTKRILSEMSLRDAVFRCGELQIPVEEVAVLLSPLSLGEGASVTLSDLSTPGTDAYYWYCQGIAEGYLKLSADLEANISNPKAKDAYKHLSAERRRQAINKKLDELF